MDAIDRVRLDYGNDCGCDESCTFAYTSNLSQAIEKMKPNIIKDEKDQSGFFEEISNTGEIIYQG